MRIRIFGFVDVDLGPVRFNYHAPAVDIVNNGHAIKVNYESGSTITVDGHMFELKQVHFHAPSEHRVRGRSFAMEGHFVHADKVGNLAVIGVMFEEGADCPLIETLWSSMPRHPGDVYTLNTKVDPMKLMPGDRAYYRYNGSLTTPPCSEGVLWLVMKNPMTVSKRQIEAFFDVMHHPNNRPVQPLNARRVLE